MLKHEFEEAIGHKVEDQDYRTIECVYMNAGDIDKKQFCNAWKTVEKKPEVNILVSFLSNEVSIMHSHKRQLVDQSVELQKKLEEANGRIESIKAYAMYLEKQLREKDESIKQIKDILARL